MRGRLKSDVPRRAKAPVSRCIKAILLLALASTTALAEADNQSEVEHGRVVFTQAAQPHCAACHALADANAKGTVGPDLDELRPTRQEVATAVAEGIETMPAYSETLSQDQIDAVAAYVARVSGAATD